MPTEDFDLFDSIHAQLLERIGRDFVSPAKLDEMRTEALEAHHDEDPKPSAGDVKELVLIEEYIDEIEQGMGESKFGENEQLILDDAFQDHAEQLAVEVSGIDESATWPINCIDWERAANELKHDYTAIEIGADTYYFRSRR